MLNIKIQLLRYECALPYSLYYFFLSDTDINYSEWPWTGIPAHKISDNFSGG